VPSDHLVTPDQRYAETKNWRDQKQDVLLVTTERSYWWNALL